MRYSSDHILTTHVGSLPRPDGLIEANRAREAGELIDEAGFQQTLRAAVGECRATPSRMPASTFRATANSANRWGTGSITARGGAMPSTASAGSNSARPAPMAARRGARVRARSC